MGIILGVLFKGDRRWNFDFVKKNVCFLLLNFVDDIFGLNVYNVEDKFGFRGKMFLLKGCWS